MVCLVNNSAVLDLEVDGCTVGEVRESVRDMLNVPRRALAYIGGTPVGSERRLKLQERLEFFVADGLKGAGNGRTRVPDNRAAIKRRQAAAGEVVEVRPRPERLNCLPQYTNEERETQRRLLQSGHRQPEIVIDENNVILAGQLTWELCQELNIKPKFNIVSGFTNDAERLEFIALEAVPLRKWGTKEKQEASRQYLMRDPEIAPRHLGDILGVSNKTVANVRKELIATGKIPQLEKLRGKDDRYRPATRTTNVPLRQLGEFQREVVPNLPPWVAGKTLNRHEAVRRRAKKHKSRIGRQTAARNAPPYRHGDFGIYHCNFRELLEVAKIEPGSVDLVFTDVPYQPDWFEENFVELCEVAYEMLTDKGIFACYIGAENWAVAGAAVLTAGFRPNTLQAVKYWKPMHRRPGVVSCREPLVVATKREIEFPNNFPNLSDVSGIYEGVEPEKNLHKWQKALAEGQMFVETFSRHGALVVDLCGGSFTTAEACYRAGRKFVGCDVDLVAVRVGQGRLKNFRRRDDQHRAAEQPIEHHVPLAVREGHVAIEKPSAKTPGVFLLALACLAARRPLLMGGMVLLA